MDVKRLRDVIIISDIPMPPSVNAMYKTVYSGGKSWRAPSKKFRDWKNHCNQFYLESAHRFRTMQALSEKIVLDLDAALELRMYFFCHEKTLFCKDGSVKRWDVSNRIKAVEDLIFDVLDQDDKLTFKLICEKVQCEDTKPESVTVAISPVKPRHQNSLLNNP